MTKPTVAANAAGLPDGDRRPPLTIEEIEKALCLFRGLSQERRGAFLDWLERLVEDKPNAEAELWPRANRSDAIALPTDARISGVRS